jgi:predicted DNA-binding transcriptional regulator AlpA
MDSSDELIGFDEIFARYGAGRNPKTFRLWLWRAQRTGRFPAAVKLSERSIAWRKIEVTTWAENLRRVCYARAA